ncbi:MAG: hypothetical protein R2798_06855 [Chitinophagales bacterium]
MELTCSVISVTLERQWFKQARELQLQLSRPNGFVSSAMSPSVSAAKVPTPTVLNSVNGCEATDQVVVTQDVSVPIASAGVDMELTCAVTSVTLDGSGSSTGADYSYSWSGPNGFSSSAMSPSVSAAKVLAG